MKKMHRYYINETHLYSKTCIKGQPKAYLKIGILIDVVS